MKPQQADQLARRALRLTIALREVLDGEDPSVAGAAIGQLAAAYLAAMDPKFRTTAHIMLLRLIDGSVPDLINGMIADGNAPPDWLKGTRT